MKKKPSPAKKAATKKKVAAKKPAVKAVAKKAAVKKAPAKKAAAGKVAAKKAAAKKAAALMPGMVPGLAEIAIEVPAVAVVVPQGDAPAVAVVAAAVPAPAPVPTGPQRAKFGNLLRAAVNGLNRGGRVTGVARAVMDVTAAAAAGGGVAAEAVLPVAISTPRVVPLPGENWTHYRQRVADVLGPVSEWLKKNAGLKSVPSYCSSMLSTRGIMGQMDEATRNELVRNIELDTPRTVTLMDDVPADLEQAIFLQNHPGLDGTGIRVAVLDSGIDLKHPWLNVEVSVETCGESVNLPGAHGTHVAGSIASSDPVFRGIAPGVTLINVKVVDQLGRGTAGMVTRGIDAALDNNADILSLSLGWNHLPTWSNGGHGWTCSDGKCELCTAVNNAVLLDNVHVVVAAGNEHQRAEALRSLGNGDSFDSEISCPGAASGAITVGAITKHTFVPASFSSRGPAASGLSKPDIMAPGVNIMSCAPTRRTASGQVVAGLTRADLSRPDSGTSMATPIVSAVVALILQRRKAEGLGTSPAEVREELLTTGVRVMSGPATVNGAGRLNLADL